MGNGDDRLYDFREHPDFWSIEPDLRPTGRFVTALVDGGTEQHELQEGDVIADGTTESPATARGWAARIQARQRGSIRGVRRVSGGTMGSGYFDGIDHCPSSQTPAEPPSQVIRSPLAVDGVEGDLRHRRSPVLYLLVAIFREAVQLEPAIVVDDQDLGRTSRCVERHLGVRLVTGEGSSPTRAAPVRPSSMPSSGEA